MKPNDNRFSDPEWIGILFMVAGLLLGFYGRIAGTMQIAASTQKFSTFLEGSGDLSEIHGAVQSVSSGLTRGLATTGLAGIGFWIFLSGIAVFVISRRQRWNKALTESRSSTDPDTEPSDADDQRDAAPPPEPDH